jgi:hypothetical protein
MGRVLQTAEVLSLRSKIGCRNLDTIRGIDMRKQLRLLSILEGLRRNRKDWLPHVDGMKEREMRKQIVWSRPKGRRDPDRSHRSWNSWKPEQAMGLIVKM